MTFIAGLLLWLPWPQAHVEKEVFFLIEEVETVFPDETVERYTNNIWVGRNRIRIDRDPHHMSIIYDLDIHIMILVDHRKKSYSISRVGREKRLARHHLVGLANQSQGILEKKVPVLKPVRGNRRINNWDCLGFRLNYPANFGVVTEIWCSPHLLSMMSKSEYRRIWYAALGTSPAVDVRNVVNQMVREMTGIPVQTISTMNVEGVTTQSVTTLTHLEKLSEVESSLLAIPSGYRKDDPDMQKQLD